jgi:type VI secretion system secreted protein VgrG
MGLALSYNLFAMAGKVECSITVDVEKIRLDKVTYLSVGQRMDAHHSFEFRMVLEDAKKETFTDHARKYLGKHAAIEINFANQTAAAKDLRFEGVVTGTSFHRSQGGSPEISISGHSKTLLLDGQGRNRSFSEKNLKQVVDALCEALGDSTFKTKIAPKYKAKLPYVVQYEESDLQFLTRLANRYGEWFFFDGTTLYFGKPADQKSEELTFGLNLFSFDIALGLQRNNFQQKHWDHKEHTLNNSSSSDQKLGLDDDAYGGLLKNPAAQLFKPGDLTMVGNAADKGDLDQRTSARKQANASRSVSFSGVSDHTRLHPGVRIKVKGSTIGDKGEEPGEYGEFYVTSVQHSSSNGNYQNHFEAVPATDDMVPIAYAHQPVCDPQSARVMHVDDPDKLGRVRVQFLWQQGGSELSPWIRVLTGHAHESGGSYLLPEVNDEVLVDFEFNDPEQPVVVGSLFNGKHKPDAAWADERNETKAFRTKGGNEVLISDKPGKESVTVRNKDGKNEVVLSLGGEPGITIKSDGKLTLDAKTIELKCQDLKVDAKTGVEVSSTKVKMDGSALVEVTGGLIKLN